MGSLAPHSATILEALWQHCTPLYPASDSEEEDGDQSKDNAFVNFASRDALAILDDHRDIVGSKPCQFRCIRLGVDLRVAESPVRFFSVLAWAIIRSPNSRLIMIVRALDSSLCDIAHLNVVQLITDMTVQTDDTTCSAKKMQISDVTLCAITSAWESMYAVVHNNNAKMEWNLTQFPESTQVQKNEDESHVAVSRYLFIL